MSEEKEYYIVEIDGEEYEEYEHQPTISDYLDALSLDCASEDDIKEVLMEFKRIENEFNDLMAQRTELIERRRAVLNALKDYTKGKPLVVTINKDDEPHRAPETHIVKVTDIGVSFLKVGSVSI